MESRHNEQTAMAAAAAHSTGAAPPAPLLESSPLPSVQRMQAERVNWRADAAASAALRAFCERMPKAELHAHLHGSIRPSTLAELVCRQEGVASTQAAQHVINTVLPSTKRSLTDCFKIFDLIHAVVRDEATVRRITAEMIQDCVADGVRYLEIRSTPRQLCDAPEGATKAQGVAHYVRAVLETVKQEEEAAAGKITVRLLLSVNRTSAVYVHRSAGCQPPALCVHAKITQRGIDKHGGRAGG
ncbi:hypothetical protein EON66_11740 [archaeon]|nr:MAG: hypothetical protein EON66_11740 [archaeon]